MTLRWRLLVCLLLASPAWANDLTVDRTSLRVGETLSITVSLEDGFATLESIRVPVRGVTLIEPPSVSSEFSWINGTVVRRKIFRYRARAEAPGPAVIGPLSVAAQGQRETLAAIAVQVLPDRASGSNDPQVVLRELRAAGRDPFFVIAEFDRTRAFAGEPILVTWWLYNATSIQEWQVGTSPALSDFWVEELDVRSARGTDVVVSGIDMQRMPVRRALLFPLHAAEMVVGSLDVDATVLRRIPADPFGSFEGNLTEISSASAPVTISVQPPPPAASGALVGDLSLVCSPPRQQNAGPVAIDVAVSGRANLRAADVPRFASPLAGEVQVLEKGVTVDRSGGSLSRRWEILIMPARRGRMAIPPLQMRTFSPSTQTLSTLGCRGVTFEVMAAAPASQSSAALPKKHPRSRSALFLLAAAAAGALLLIAVVTALRRHLVRRGVIRSAVAEGSPQEIRERLQHFLDSRGIDPGVLMREGSSRGDAWRAVRSLLDAREARRTDLDSSPRELRRRVAELVRAIRD